MIGGGSHPIFEEKFVFEFIEGVVELNIWVLTNRSSGNEEALGFLRVELQQVLFNGYVDSTWTLHSTDGRPAGFIRLTLQFPPSSRFQGQGSIYEAPTLDSTAPVGTPQAPIWYQLLPYDARPPPRPASFVGPNASYPPNSAVAQQPNGTGPAAQWSQFLPYGSPSPAAPACAYNSTTTPPLGYPLPQYPPGLNPFDIYPPRPRDNSPQDV
ncbi:hypothetical protein SDJN02_01418, partial [Cucurbita argyrosperma subsp. argyrosperma]